MSGASMRWLAIIAGLVPRGDPVRLDRTSCATTRSSACRASSTRPADPQGSGYQLIQSQIAVGSGGLFGKGLTNGTQDAARLPAGPDDRLRVGPSWPRSSGFIGAIARPRPVRASCSGGSCCAGWRSQDRVRPDLRRRDRRRCSCSSSSSTSGMVIGIMPITGIPLPFITHGGASLISIAHRPRASSRASTSGRPRRIGDLASNAGLTPG